jgi:hypothetical protein
MAGEWPSACLATLVRGGARTVRSELLLDLDGIGATDNTDGHLAAQIFHELGHLWRDLLRSQRRAPASQLQRAARCATQRRVRREKQGGSATLEAGKYARFSAWSRCHRRQRDRALCRQTSARGKTGVGKRYKPQLDGESRLCVRSVRSVSREVRAFCCSGQSCNALSAVSE